MIGMLMAFLGAQSASATADVWGPPEDVQGALSTYQQCLFDGIDAHIGVIKKGSLSSEQQTEGKILFICRAVRRAQFAKANVVLIQHRWSEAERKRYLPRAFAYADETVASVAGHIRARANKSR
jgi:hypothetical protein